MGNERIGSKRKSRMQASKQRAKLDQQNGRAVHKRMSARARGDCNLLHLECKKCSMMSKVKCSFLGQCGNHCINSSNRICTHNEDVKTEQFSSAARAVNATGMLE